MQRITIARGLCVLGASLLAIVACKSASGSVHGVGELDVPGGRVRFEGSLGAGDDNYQAQNDSDNCYELKFYDANGNVTGTHSLTPGANHGSIPTGSTSWTAVDKDCPPDDEGGGGWSNQEVAPVRRATSVYTVVGGPLWFDRDSTSNNSVFCFSVRAFSVGQAHTIARETIEAPIGTSIDPRVTVHTFFKAVENLASASVIGISRTPFTTFEMDVNQTPNFASLLDGAVQTQVSSDIWIVNAPISLLDINGYDSWNVLVLRTQHAENPTVQETEQAMVHFD